MSSHRYSYPNVIPLPRPVQTVATVEKPEKKQPSGEPDADRSRRSTDD